MKKRIFAIISKADEGDRASKVFDNCIMILIVLSVVSIILESYRNLAQNYAVAFRIFECISIAVFTVEYALRIWTADLLYPGAKHPRLRYMRSFMAVIDLLAILPFFIPFIPLDLRFLRMVRLLRLFRLLRVFKLGRYLDAFMLLMKVIRKSAPQLVVSIILCAFVMLFSAIVMYTVENPEQPEQFPNVISSLWWAICTLTTVGYGDVYPVTATGKLFASIISVIGIGIIAIPTGIIAAGFSSVIHERSGGDKESDGKEYCPYCGHKLE
ncbi:MAG: ion transporter [Clostridia bacterium]|nr:ion transporter [Clostridia bacterium]